MDNLVLLLGIPVLLLNVVGFLIMGYDKGQAKTGGWRIPERSLLLIAFAGGATGILLGMKVFHHKTKHFTFTWGIPLLVILNWYLFYRILLK